MMKKIFLLYLLLTLSSCGYRGYSVIDAYLYKGIPNERGGYIFIRAINTPVITQSLHVMSYKGEFKNGVMLYYGQTYQKSFHCPIFTYTAKQLNSMFESAGKERHATFVLDENGLHMIRRGNLIARHKYDVKCDLSIKNDDVKEDELILYRPIAR